MALVSLDRLQSLKIDIVILNGLGYQEEGIEHEVFLFVFESLKPVRAQVFEIELNIELPHEVKAALGQVPFIMKVHKRPLDFKIFPLPA